MYATANDMIERFGRTEMVQLTDDARLGDIDETPINAALADAANLIDSYVGKIYQVPISPAPAILIGHQCDLARYNIWSKKGQMPEIVMTRYKDVLKWLGDVSRGLAVIEAQGITAAQTSDSAILVAPPRRFTAKSLGRF